LSGLSDRHWKVFKKVHLALASRGIDVRLVGGSVRDHLRGIEPKDLDFAVNSEPERAMRAMMETGHQTVPTGLKHGTFTAVVDGFPVEITSLRKDVSTDGRHAEVEWTRDWREDSCRRDLTINAMYMDIDSRVYDYHHGMRDLKNNVIRFVGKPAARIEEDHLRILRYYRFCAMLDNPTFDMTTTSAILKAAPLLEQVSGERVWSEITKLVVGPSAHRTLDEMYWSGALFYAAGVKSPDDGHHMYTMDFNFGSSHLKRLASDPRATSPLYRIAAMVPSLERLELLRARLKYDSNSHGILSHLVRHRGRVLWVDGPETINGLLAQFVDPNLLYMESVFNGQERQVEYLEELRRNPLPKFPVSGDDLKALGLVGKDIGAKLMELRTLWSRDFTQTREQLLERIGETCVD
jgi:tRNA nucleotidyltransferase/poly(A) polymerase